MDKLTPGKLVIFSGPSGSGKDTVFEQVLARDPTIRRSISFTTRNPRDYEKDGIHYHFITHDDFLKKLDKGLVLEYAEYGGNFYGTPKEPVDELLMHGKTVILIIEVQGAARVRELYPGALTIFLLPPSLEVLENRLRTRDTDGEEHIQTRLAIAREELRRKNEYRFHVVNDDLSRAVGEVLEIIHNNSGA
jgi:guanylate kinase